MNHQFQDIIDSLPSRPHRSRLAPYAELIGEMRTRGWTYRAIARLLAESCGLRVSPSNVHYFVKTESRREESRRKQQSVLNETVKVPTDSVTNKKGDVHERIAALKNSASQAEFSENKFEFDPDEPLHLNRVPNANIGDRRQKS